MPCMSNAHLQIDGCVGRNCRVILALFCASFVLSARFRTGCCDWRSWPAWTCPAQIVRSCASSQHGVRTARLNVLQQYSVQGQIVWIRNGKHVCKDLTADGSVAAGLS
eukprot:194178-Rhodomonas_salina.3